MKSSKQNKKATAKPKKSRKNKTGSSSQVKAPVAQGRVNNMSRPMTKNLPNGDILVRHREYVRDIRGSVDFEVNQVKINPGLQNIFPWLSQIANAYESYLFDSLIFDFETSSNTTSNGSVILTVDYDPEDGPPMSKAQAMAYRNAVRSPSWAHSHFISIREDLNKRKTYFVRRGQIPNATLPNYDVGQLFVCTQGQLDDSIVGELYVEYVVRLITPQSHNLAVGGSIYLRLTGNSNATKFNNKAGTLDLTVTQIDTQICTWTFNQPWEGYVTFSIVGTGLDASPLTLVDITLVEGVGVVSLPGGQSSTTSGLAFFALTMSEGCVISVTVTNATITSSAAYFGQANV